MIHTVGGGLSELVEYVGQLNVRADDVNGSVGRIRGDAVEFVPADVSTNGKHDDDVAGLSQADRCGDRVRTIDVRVSVAHEY